MNDSVLVNQVYLIFNRPQFLVDSSGIEKIGAMNAMEFSFTLHQTGIEYQQIRLLVQ